MTPSIPPPLLLGLFLLLVGGGGAAAQPLSVQAFADRTTLGDAESVLYTVEVRGPFGSLGAVEPPPTRGLVPRQTAPVQRWDVTTRGGRTEHVLRLQWQFDPLRPGDAEIGRATLVLDGRRYTTDPIPLRVVPQSQRPLAPSPTLPQGTPRPDATGAQPSPDLFLRADPPRATAYVGEQVTLDHVIYFAPETQPRNARITRSWDAPGFWREDLELPLTPEVRDVTIEGRAYDAVTLKRTAFFPTRSGTLVVDSLAVDVDVLRGFRAGRPGGLYSPFGGRHRRETLVAPPVRVEVLPLPDGAPAAFRGAVGTFTMDVSADRAEVAVGEPVRLTVVLRGNGNLATLEPPPGAPPPSFELYPPQEEVSIRRGGRRLEGERRTTYTLVPRSGGTFELPPLTWAYFDPEGGAYRTLVSEPIPLRVVGSAAALAEGGGTGREIRQERGGWRRRTPPSSPPYRHPLVLGGVALPLLALIALAVARRRRDARPADSPLARSLRAFPEAAAALRGAERLHGTPPDPRYYAALDAALRRFLSERLGVPPSLPPADLDRALAEGGAGEETRREVQAVLAACAAGQFGPTSLAVAAPSPAQVAHLVAAVDAEARPLAGEAG